MKRSPHRHTARRRRNRLAIRSRASRFLERVNIAIRNRPHDGLAWSMTHTAEVIRATIVAKEQLHRSALWSASHPTKRADRALRRHRLAQR